MKPITSGSGIYRLLGLTVLGLVGIFVVPQPVQANPCDEILKQGNYDLAAPCFLRLAQKMKTGKKLSRLRKKRKALFLDKASYAYKEAAKREKNPEKKAYLHERSLAPLQQILKENLCPRAFGCSLVQGKLAEIRKSVGYAQLTLVVQTKNVTQASIRGFQYHKRWKLTQTKTIRLRPGSYRIVSKEAGKAQKNHNIKLQPGSSKSLTVAALVIVKQARRKPVSKVAPWILIGVGLAATVASGIMLGIGYAELGGAVDLARKATSARTPLNIFNSFKEIAAKEGRTRPLDFIQLITSTAEREQATTQGYQELTNLFNAWERESVEITNKTNMGNTLVGAGWPLAGVGLVATLTGIIWLATLPSNASSKTPKATSLTPPPNTGSRVIFWQEQLHN